MRVNTNKFKEASRETQKKKIIDFKNVEGITFPKNWCIELSKDEQQVKLENEEDTNIRNSKAERTSITKNEDKIELDKNKTYSQSKLLILTTKKSNISLLEKKEAEKKEYK